MTTRVITSDYDFDMLGKFLFGMKKPFTVRISKGKPRSWKQNRLNRLWMQEIAAQMVERGDPEWTEERARAFCKLHMGVPLLRAEDETYRDKYDRIIKPHSYEEKLEMMMEPFDFPVTRLMSTEQEKRYLDEVQRYFSQRGMILTDPDARGREAAE